MPHGAGGPPREFRLHRSLRYLPEALAVAVTLLNAAKPPVVDDTAYLLFARHLATDPLHPYSFALFWNDAPQPAMEVLAPPVLPLWLAAGIALFGENLFALKLWLLPFLWLFTRGVWSLLGEFAPREQARGTVLLTFSPAILPLVNFMIDIPAVACGLAGTACLVRAHRGGRAGWLVGAVLLGAAAAQAKYTMIVLPAVWCWYGVTHRFAVRAAVACVGAVALFAAWEFFVARQCGESHFLHHLARQQPGAGDADLGEKLGNYVGRKGALVLPLLAYLGGLAAGWGLYAGPAVGFPRWLSTAVALAAAAGMAGVVLLPAASQTLFSDANGTPVLTLPSVVFLGLGGATLLTTALAAGRLFERRRPETWFLAGWLLIELAGFFVLTPFPAARRVIMPTVVIGLVACACVSRATASASGARPPWPAVAFSLALGFGLFSLDTWDARVEPAAADAAVDSILPTPGRLWTQGHWGWQYAMDRRGARLVDPGVSQLRRGDWLILAVPPDADGFYRPYHGDALFTLDPERTRFVRRRVWDDRLSGTTVPTLYGGRYPFTGRDHPRLAVEIHRVVADWVPQPPAPAAPP